MILHAFSHRGSFAFRDPISIDFDALPSLIALHGPNGAGKTTVMDLICGVLYLTMPYRPGSLVHNFAASGNITLLWSVGAVKYSSVVKVDIAAERLEASLYQVGGPLLAGPLTRDYRRAVERILGPLELFLASAYAVQSGAGAFLRLPRADRKALLTDMLGLQRFPVLEERAKKQGAGVESEIAVIRARLADLAVRAGERPALAQDQVGLETRRREITHEIGTAQSMVTQATQRATAARETLAGVEPLKKRLADLEVEIRDLGEQLDIAERRRANNQKVMGQGDEIRAAQVNDGRLAGELADLDRRIAEASAAYRTAVTAARETDQARHRATTRVERAERTLVEMERQAGIRGGVPCGGVDPYAGCQFLKDAVAATDGLPAARAEVAAAKTEAAPLRVGTIPQDGSVALSQERRLKVDARTVLKPLLELVGPLEAVKARLEELAGAIALTEATLEAKGADRASIQARLSELPALEAEVRVTQVDVTTAESKRRQLQQTMATLEREAGALEAKLQAALAAETEHAALTDKVTPLARDVADWSLLAKAFGASGIPALLIDQALPEIGRLASELLRECFGESVFTIALTTQRENAAGDRLLETLDVVVRRGGAPLDAALLSGGEAVLVSEALSLALALYNATRSGRRFETLLRDEVSAPLDVDRAPAYARMLRRAAQLGGFRHVMFVSHQSSCLELADARIEVRDGQIRAT